MAAVVNRAERRGKNEFIFRVFSFIYLFILVCTIILLRLFLPFFVVLFNSSGIVLLFFSLQAVLLQKNRPVLQQSD